MPVLSADTAVRCPECNSVDTKVTSIKWNDKGTRVRRYRKCNECDCTFRTTQNAEKVDNEGQRWKRSYQHKGEQVVTSVVTAEDVRDMRRDYESKRLNQKQIAMVYGVSHAQVNRIVRRIAWAHVT